MYDLYPVQQSFRSDYLGLPTPEVERLSPGRHLGRVSCPITVTNGSAETPESRRQAVHFYAGPETLADGDNAHRYIQARGLNHFDMWFSLADPRSAMGRVALEQIGLATS